MIRVSLYSLLFLLSFTGTKVFGQSPTGLKIGTKVKNFTLKNQQHKDRSLKALLKKGKLAIVFHRSIRW